MTFYTRQNKILNEIGFFFLCIESDTGGSGETMLIYMYFKETTMQNMYLKGIKFPYTKEIQLHAE